MSVIRERAAPRVVRVVHCPSFRRHPRTPPHAGITWAFVDSDSALVIQVSAFVYALACTNVCVSVLTGSFFFARFARTCAGARHREPHARRRGGALSGEEEEDVAAAVERVHGGFTRCRPAHTRCDAVRKTLRTRTRTTFCFFAGRRGAVGGGLGHSEEADLRGWTSSGPALGRAAHVLLRRSGGCRRRRPKTQRPGIRRRHQGPLWSVAATVVVCFLLFHIPVTHPVCRPWRRSTDARRRTRPSSSCTTCPRTTRKRGASGGRARNGSSVRVAVRRCR